MPCVQKTKAGNRSNIVTNSIKTLKIVHIKKNLFLKKGTFLQIQPHYEVLGLRASTCGLLVHGGGVANTDQPITRFLFKLHCF